MSSCKRIIKIISFPTPKKWLFLAMAILWMVASVKVLMIAWKGMFLSGIPKFGFLFLCIAGAILFSRFVLIKVTKRHIKWIHSISSDRPSLFFMMSIRNYLLLALMILMGIITGYFHIIPIPLLSLFMGALGISLFFSSLRFLRAWQLNTAINKYLE